MASNMETDDLPFPVCDECGRAFDEKTHKPLALPCGHVYCSRCISNMEDRSHERCPNKNCLKSWEERNVVDFQTVFNLIPPTGRAVVEAPARVADDAATGREVTPADVGMSGRGTGREVTPAQSDGGAAGTLAGFPTCLVCMNHYSEYRDDQPVLLPCGHAFCYFCLKELRGCGETACPCPTCRASWQGKNLDRLPVIWTLIHPENKDKKAGKSFPMKGARSDTNCKLSREEVLSRANEMKNRSRQSPSQHKTVESELSEIFVRTINGQTITLRLNLRTGTVEQLREALRQQLGVLPVDQRLLHNGRELEHRHPLIHYSMKANDTVTMVARMRGGQQGRTSVTWLLG